MNQPNVLFRHVRSPRPGLLQVAQKSVGDIVECSISFRARIAMALCPDTVATVVQTSAATPGARERPRQPTDSPRQAYHSRPDLPRLGVARVVLPPVNDDRKRRRQWDTQSL